MTPLEKAERWLGVSVRDGIRAASSAAPNADPDALQSIIEALWLDLYNRRIRMFSAQKSRTYKQ